MLSEALYIFSVLALLIFLVWASVYIISLIVSWFRGAPYVPTADREVSRILNHLHPDKNDYFLELGCGDGRVLRKAAQIYGVRGKGVDINPIVLSKAKILCSFQKLQGIHFSAEDVKETDFSDADIIYIFLFPKLVQELRDKLLNKTKKNVTIVSHGFKIPYLNTYQSEVLAGPKFKTYIYRKPHN